MVNPDAYVHLGDVTDCEGQPWSVYRDFDRLDLTCVGPLSPAGVAELQQRIDAYWQELACYRLRTADLSGFDLDEARACLLTLPGVGDPGDLEDIDWLEIGRRLHALRGTGGFGELRRLHALLTGTETPKGA
jgi:hypothetical protein